MDIINTKFRSKEQESKSKDQGKKRSLGVRMQLRGGEDSQKKKK